MAKTQGKNEAANGVSAAAESNKSVPAIIPTDLLNDDQRRTIFRCMVQAREFDLAMLRMYRQGRAFGGVYSQFGNEATAVATAFALDANDALFPMHRDIGAHFVRGQSVRAMMLNHLAREGSMMRGTDGTGHYADPAKKIYGNVSHLGAMIPVAAGYALADAMRGVPTVVMTYIGDGGAQIGDFHEALNFAAVQKLPLIVVIENNQYAYSTPNHQQFACASLADRAKGYGCEGRRVDGCDPEQVYEVCARFVKAAREGKGPALIESVTMRMRGHAEHDDFSYVPKSMLEYWSKRDPVDRYQAFLEQEGIMSSGEIETMRKELSTEMNAVIDEVVELNFPPAEEGGKSVFVD